MPSDASIYSMIRPQAQQQGPLDNYTQMLQVKHLMGQGATEDLRRQELEREIQGGQKIRDLFSRGGEVKPEDVMAIDHAKGLAYQKSQLDNQKTQGDINKTKIETFAAGAKQLRDMVAQARSDADMPAIREFAFKFIGPDAVKNIPERFDPQWQVKTIQTGDQMLAQIEAQKGRDLTERGQNLTDERTRSEGMLTRSQPVWDSERGVFVQRPNMGGSVMASPNGGVQGPTSPVQAPTVVTPANLPPKQEKPPSGYRFAADGKTLEPIAGGPAAVPKALTEHQGKATAFSMRMGDADKIIQGLEGSTSFDPTAISNQLAGRTGIATPLNYLAPKEAQKYEQAKRNWVTANLRLESGAAIPEPELAQEYRKWFPLPGDDPEVVKQKAASRKVAEEAMHVQAGPGGARPSASTPPTNTPVRIRGDDGYAALASGALFVGPDGKTRRKP